MLAHWFSRLLGRSPPTAPASDEGRLVGARAAVNASHRMLLGADEAGWSVARLALILDAEALRLLLPAESRREHLAASGATESEVDALLTAVDRSPADRDALSPEVLADESRRVHELALRELDALAARLDVHAPRRRRVVAVVGAVVAAACLGTAGWRLAPRRHPNLAATAVWHTSGVESGYLSTGVGASSVGTTNPAFFHTDKQDDPWIRFDFPTRPEVGFVEVTNRGDCCLERAVPLVVEGDPGDGRWRELAQRTTTFYRWSATFPRQRLAAVRLRARGNTWLHLSVVEIR